jgi:uncharacterized protein
MNTTERRFTALPVETRAGRNSARTIGGYAATFNRESRNLGGYVETVTASAFNKSRGDGWPDVVARYNHDDNMLLGTTAANTLRLNVDNVGLAYDVDVPESRADVHELVERGDVRKSSFAFIVRDDDWALTEQNFPERRLLSVQLVDVAPVNVPAYVDSSVGLRSLAAKFDADVAEVRSLAEQNELRKFFTTTDKAAPLSVAHARAELLKHKSITLA